MVRRNKMSLLLSDYMQCCGGVRGNMDPEKLSVGQTHIFVLAIAEVAGGMLLIDELNSKLDT